MASISVPDSYRQSILQEELDVGQSSLEQVGIQCRQQLSMSHTIGSCVNCDASHPQPEQVDIETGRCTPQQQGIQVRSSSCKTFSIRGYVANVRETDVSKCWPFHPSLLQRRMEENIVTLLPPLEVPTYRYWECSECLENEFNLDISDKRRNDEYWPDNLTDAMGIISDTNFPSKLSEYEITGSGNGEQNLNLMRNSANDLQEEEASLEVAQHIAVDKRSGEASVENHKEIFDNEDRLALPGPIKQLTSNNTSDSENSCSINAIVACNATVWPTDSEETSSANQIFSSRDNYQILPNHTRSQMKDETDISSFTEKADHITYIPCTMNTIAMCDLDENIYQENHENITTEEAMEKFINEIPGDNTSALSTLDNADEEGCIIKVDNNGILPNIKKRSAKKRNCKAKTLKKRLISDLIAATPFDQLRCNEANRNAKLKHMSRKKKIGMWRASKAATYSLQKFKAPDKPHIESVDIKRKPHCQSVSYQSSPSAKSVKEARRVIKRHLRSQKLESPQKKMLSKASQKQVALEALVQNELERQTDLDPEDDLLNDLAHFMAKIQHDRCASAPKSSSLQETECLRGSTVNNKEAKDSSCFVVEKSDKSSDPIQLRSNQSLKDNFNKGTDTFSCSPTKHASVDGQVHLLVGHGGKINEVQESGKHEKQEMSEQAKDSSQSLKDGFSKGADAFNCIPTKHSSVDGQVHLFIEDGKMINQVPESGKHDNQEMSGQAEEADVILESVIGPFLSSDHHACKNTKTVDKNLDKHLSVPSVSDKDSIGSAVMMKTQRRNGSSTFQKELIEHLEKLLNSSNDQLSNIEKSNVALDTAIHNFSSNAFKDYNNGSDESVPSKFFKDTLHSHNNGLDLSVPRISCNDMALNTVPTVAVTSFGPVPTIAAESAAYTQTAVQPSLAPFHFQITSTSPNVLTDLENFESSDLTTTHVYQTENCPKGNQSYTAFSAGYNPLLSVLQPTMGENFFMNLLLGSTDRDFTFESSGGIVEQAKDQVGEKQGTCMAQPITTFPVLGGTGQQPLKILNDVPVKNFSMEHRSSNKSRFQPPFDCFLPCITLNTPSSMEAEPTADAAMHKDYSQSLRSPVILTSAQGNKLDTQTTLSRECFDQGKIELQSYIENRIQSYCSSQSSNKSATSKTKKGPWDDNLQTAVSQDPNLFTINKNAPDFMGSENSLLKKMRVGDRQRVGVIASSADEHCTRDMEVKQAEPDSNTASSIRLPLSEINALVQSTEAAMENSDGQNCRREMVVEMSHGHADSQTTVPGEKITTFEKPNEQNRKRRKFNKVKQAEMATQTSEPVAAVFSQTDLPVDKIDSQWKITLRSGKSLDPAYLKNTMHANNPPEKRRKYVKKVEKKARKTKAAQSHSIQTETHAMHNHMRPDNFSANQSSQDMPSDTNHFAGLKNVLKPITQNTREHLHVLSVHFPADHQDKEAAEVRLEPASWKMNITGPEKKLKSQLPAMPYDPRAIENYIKWGTFSGDPPPSQALPTKVSEPVKLGSLPHYSTLDQNGKFVNPAKSGAHPIINGTEYNLPGIISNTSSFSIPSCAINTNFVVTPSCADNTNIVVTPSFADNTNIGIPSDTSNDNSLMPSSAGNGEIVIPAYANNANGNNANPTGAGDIVPGLLKPLGVFEQQALLSQIQDYLDKSNLNFSSFNHAERSVSTSKDSSTELN